MDSVQAQEKIEQLKSKQQAIGFLESLGVSLLIGLPLAALLIHLLSWTIWLGLVIPVLVYLAVILYKPFWKIDATTVAKSLNITYPELEESTELLLQDEKELNILQVFQQRKIAAVLLQLQVKTKWSRIYRAMAFAITGIVLFTAILKFAQLPAQKGIDHPGQQGSATVLKERLPAAISNVKVQIIPPAYTGMSSRTQQLLNLKAENESMIHWEITTTVPVKQFSFIFNDKETLKLRPADEKGTHWVLNKKMMKPGFYQIELDGRKSDLYQIELLADLPVVIQITHPEPHTTIDYGEPKEVNLRVNLQDDYGIQDAFISATMASGKGEGVSFTERKLQFNASFNGQKNQKLQKHIDLNALGMKPGDELYLFVSARDNHGQSSRSDVYFVSIADTTELMSLSGLTSGVNLVPEYFRSQRQIIMDTEKLLAERNKITVQEFKTKSNEIGTDQKLLRMRYGKFLGEESETEIGGGHAGEEDHDHDEEGHSHAKPEEKTEVFGDVQAIMDSYAHKHDIAEDATFFEPEVKSRLKAVLTEMWNSELKLRTFQTQEALPYAYKALRLLKDLQQKSRAFVAKTTVKVSQLKEEKRFSGELDKIGEPVMQQERKDPGQQQQVLKEGLALLEELKHNKKASQVQRAGLWEIEKQLVVAAVDHPDTYLPALRAIRDLKTTDKYPSSQLSTVQKALKKLLSQEITVPQASTDLPGSALYQQYFNQLKKDLR